jgi:hypothetical protein
MRFTIMHRTNAHWESGAIPGPDLLARVGALLQRMSDAGILGGAEGLRPSSDGVRLNFASGACTVARGPFEGTGGLPADFTIVRAETLDDAIDAAKRHHTGEDVVVDIRPVTEPWDIGLGDPPANATGRRDMILRRSTPSEESDVASALSKRPKPVAAEATTRVTHLAAEAMQPSRRGRRYKNSLDGIIVSDGPFTETKELIGGYVIVSVASLDEADLWAREYLRAVDADEVDLRELA